jgi:hypothetical protein
MVTLRCTQRLLKELGVKATDTPPPTTALGDWYANVIPTLAGDFVICASERTLLGVVIPMMRLLPVVQVVFVTQVRNLLGLLNVPDEWVKPEIKAMGELGIGRTASRSILASLNDMTYQFQWYVEAGVDSGTLDLVTAELNLSQTFHTAIGMRWPVDVALDLFTAHYVQASSTDQK